MRSERAWMLPLLVMLAATFSWSERLPAQMMLGGPTGPGGMGGYGMGGPAGDPSAAAHWGAGGYGYGPQGMMPAGYQGGAEVGPMMPAPMYVDGPGYQTMPGMQGGGDPSYYEPPGMAEYGHGGSDIWCSSCAGFGCRRCLGSGIGAGMFRRAASETLEFILPYTDGGCCTQRWYDIHVEYMNLTREQTVDFVPIASDGLLGPVVLSTDDLEFDEGHGFRFTGAVQVAAGSNLEFSYFGTFNYADEARVTSATNSLFSVFSDFGLNPFGGFQETDNANLQSIAYSSTFDSFELNYRRRWVGPFCRYQGSWLAGVRYFILDEDFLYQSRTLTGFMDYEVSTYNSITGFQVGGDFWACIIPGIMVGVEAKGGIYGNAAQQDTTINATTIINPPSREEADKDVASFIGEAGLMAIYKLTPKVTLRTGYQFLVVEGVALAPENFNTAPPFVSGERAVGLNESGEVYYHGYTAGLEYMW